MRTLISVLLLITFLTGVAAICTAFYTPMNLFLKTFVFLSGIINAVVAIEFVKRVTFVIVEDDNQEEEEE